MNVVLNLLAFNPGAMCDIVLVPREARVQNYSNGMKRHENSGCVP